MNNPPPPVPKQGLSTLAKVGLGCGTLLILAFIGGGLLAAKGGAKFNEFAGEAQKRPVTTAAKLALTVMPDFELVKADEQTKEITVKNTKTGQTTTMTLDELMQGKMKVTDDKGNVTTFDPSSSGGQMKVQSSEGSVVIGGDSTTPLPAWIPAYPGATATPGGIRSEKGDKVSGMSVVESTDPLTKVKEFYDSKLKEAGFKVDSTLAGADAAVLSGTKDATHETLQVTISRADNKTTIMFTYEGPK